jgi:hypothetical protein
VRHGGHARVCAQVFGNANEAGQGLCDMIKQASATAIQQRGIFTLAVTSPECATALASLIGASSGGGGAAPAPAAAPAAPRPVSPIRGGRDRKRAMMAGMANAAPQPQAAVAAPQAPSGGGGGGGGGVDFEKWYVLFASESMNGHPNFTAMRDQFLLQVRRRSFWAHMQ